MPAGPDDQIATDDRTAVGHHATVSRTKSTSLADRLVTAIAIATYSPGERLPPERELALSLGVSRVTLREALRQVADLGLIESRRGRGGGTFVATTAWEDVAPEVARRTLEVEIPRLLDLFDYRCLVEGMIARAAAERRTADDITKIRSALEEFRHAAGMIDARSADRRLHGLICAAARNPHLTSLSARLTAEATLGFGAEPYDPEFLTAALEQHTDLVGHVIRGEADAAGRAAQAHFTLTLETMRAGLRRASERVAPPSPPSPIR
ncbi:FadR/GntR family transcriptional regulator [Microlunatus soli]|uniref:DNA-binding transcriptional regulator, FadR family n=1 Tax=Microlunatus soli TaxID=630515 RepID=A0A1H1Q289_9ACTN|nr:FCD domain-containing protein [Microlunatus soli]SDS17514.1 DNA-binding transcriptional regulator, FadR family [Microlunatus soli]